MRLSQFNEVGRRDEARTRDLTWGQEGSVDSRLFQWAFNGLCGSLEY